MSGLLLSGCCNPCAGDEEQCAVHYEFHDTAGRGQFESYDDPNGTTPVAVNWDLMTASVNISGQGVCAAVVDTASTYFTTIHAAATIINLTSGSVGVSIRRPESTESISLWWLGGDDFELRHGSTVLESIVHSPANGEIKLELTTPKLTATDVNVYIGGVLVHTETAVAFVLPEVLYFGVAIDGAAVLGSIGVSPCPCLAAVYTCSDVDLPLFWTTSISGVGDPTKIDPPACSGGGDPLDVCEQLNGDYTLVWGELVVAHRVTPSSTVEWTGGLFSPINNDGVCMFPATTRTRNVPYTIPLPNSTVAVVPPSPAGTIPYLGKIASGDEATIVCNGDYGRSGWNGISRPWAVGTITVATSVLGVPIEDGLGNPMVRVTAGFRFVVFDNSDAFYYQSSVNYSKDFPLATDLRTETLTLDFQSVEGCLSYPGSITIEPTPTETEEDRRFLREVLGCNELCTPPVTPAQGYEYFTWITFEDQDGQPWDYPTCMGISFNETTGSWEWSGSSVQGHVHPTCGPLPDDLVDFQVKIHCIEPQEGAARQWVLEITTPNGTARIPQVEDVNLGYVFEGTADNMCAGETWNVAATPVSRVDPETSATLGGCPQSPCTALWLRGGITIGCADSSYVQSSVYLNRMAKGNVGSPPSEWTVPGVDPALIVDTDVYGGIFPFGGGAYRIWVYSVSAGSYQVRITGPGDELITATGEGLVCQPGGPSLNLASAPYDWFGRPGGDPFGVCPGPDESAFIDFVWF